MKARHLDPIDDVVLQLDPFQARQFVEALRVDQRYVRPPHFDVDNVA